MSDHPARALWPGDQPDPTLLRTADGWYATFSCFDRRPGLVVWHSADFVHWRPLAAALDDEAIGAVYAPDIVLHGGRWFIYFAALRRDPPPGVPAMQNWVVHAAAPQGPWSPPIALGLPDLIDPGHAVDHAGQRWLFLNDGHRVPLAPDGLALTGPVEKAYAGWPMPADWLIEGVWLEGPKIVQRHGWYFMLAAQGGTGGPPTGHMVVVARARSLHGPWQNAPHNPLLRTTHRRERWWSRGHATLVDGPDGRDWLVYHAYERGRLTLGRQTLAEPLQWVDGWPVLRRDRTEGSTGGDGGPAAVAGVIAVAGAGAGAEAEAGARTTAGHRAAPDTTDTAARRPHALPLGLDLAFQAPRPGWRQRVRLDGDAIHLLAEGASAAQTAPLVFTAYHARYAVEVEVERLDPGVQAGLLLWYDARLHGGLGGSGRLLHLLRAGIDCPQPPLASPGRRFALRLVNDDQIVALWVRPEGGDWRLHGGLEVSGYQHNVGHGFGALRPALYACGSGAAVFRSLRYRALAPVEPSEAWPT